MENFKRAIKSVINDILTIYVFIHKNPNLEIPNDMLSEFSISKRQLIEHLNNVGNLSDLDFSEKSIPFALCFLNKEGFFNGITLPYLQDCFDNGSGLSTSEEAQLLKLISKPIFHQYIDSLDFNNISKEFISNLDKDLNFNIGLKSVKNSYYNIKDHKNSKDLYELISSLPILLSNHPSHFVVSQLKNSKCPSTADIKNMFDDLILKDPTANDRIVSTYELLKSLKSGSDVIEQIIILREKYSINTTPSMAKLKS